MRLVGNTDDSSILLSLWVRSRRRYLRYCYHSIFVLRLMNDKDRMIAIAQIAFS